MSAILRWELQQRRTAIVWWTLASLILVVVLLLIYPSIHQQSQQLNKVINTLPAGLRELKTGTSGVVDVGSAIGFLNSQLYYATLPLLLIIMAITRGSALIGKEESSHSLELLLARPISRGRLLAAKALSGIIELGIVASVSTIAILALNHAVGLDVSSGRLLMASLYTTLFSLSFGAIAFAITAYGRGPKRASTAIAVLLSLGGYLLTTLGGLTHYLATPAKLAPYHYFSPDKILNGQPVVGLNVYLLVVFSAAPVVAYLGFRARDID